MSAAGEHLERHGRFAVSSAPVVDKHAECIARIAIFFADYVDLADRDRSLVRSVVNATFPISLHRVIVRCFAEKVLAPSPSP